MSKFIKQSNTITEKIDIVGINKQPYYNDIDILVGVNSIIKNSHIVSLSSSIASQQSDLLYIIYNRIDDDINPNNNLMIINSGINSIMHRSRQTFKVYNSHIFTYEYLYSFNLYDRYNSILCNQIMKYDIYMRHKLLVIYKKLRAI